MSNTISSSSGTQGVYTQSPSRSLSDNQTNKLNGMKAIDLSDPDYINKHPELQQLHDKVKNLHINTDNWGGFNSTYDLEANAENQSAIMEQYGDSMAYHTFENAIENMHDISHDQKVQLRNAVIAATGTMQAQQQQGDTYGMRIAQTNLELKYVSKNLVNEEWQDKFNSLIDDYTKKFSDDFIGMVKNISDQLINTKDPSLIASGWHQRGQEMQNDLSNGNDIFQTTSKIYSNLYSKVDISKPETIKNSLDSVYSDILTNGHTYTKGSSSKQDLLKEVNYLREKWNNVMSAMNGTESQKFITSLNCYA